MNGACKEITNEQRLQKMIDRQYVLLAATLRVHLLEWHGACWRGQPAYMRGSLHGQPPKLHLILCPLCENQSHSVLCISSQRSVQLKTCQLFDLCKISKYFKYSCVVKPFILMYSILFHTRQKDLEVGRNSKLIRHIPLESLESKDQDKVEKITAL